MNFLILAGAACGSLKISSLGQNRISANTWRVSRLVVHKARAAARAYTIRVYGKLYRNSTMLELNKSFIKIGTMLRTQKNFSILIRALQLKIHLALPGRSLKLLRYFYHIDSILHLEFQ